MRNLHKFSILLIVLPVIFFVACNEDSETPEAQLATLLFNSDMTFEGIPGDTAASTVSVHAPDGLVGLVITKRVGDGNSTPYDNVTPDPDATVLTYEFEYILVEAEIDEIVYFDFTVDHDGAETPTKTFTVETNSPPARSYTAVLIYSPTDDKKSASFFSTNLGLTFSSDSVINSEEIISPNIDFGYYYGAQEDSASLSSVSAYPTAFAVSQGLENWISKNETQFFSTDLTASEYNELTTFADIDAVYEGGIAEQQIITHLDEGEVYAFSTDADKEGGSKKGVLLIKTITGTFNQGDNIEIEVLVQESAN